MSEEVKAAGDVIVVDLGKASSKRIKSMRRGKGKLIGDVRDALAELAAEGGLPAGATPVVFVVKEKRKKNLSSILMG